MKFSPLFFWQAKKNIVVSMALMLSGLASFVLSGCDSESTKSKTELVLGTSADMPPFEFYQDEKIVGFDIDLAALIAKELGKTLVIKDMDFSTLIPALQSNRVDVVMSSMTPTPERRVAVSFSKPYLTLPLSVISKKDINFSNVENFSGHVVGVQLGTTHEQYANNLAKKYESITVRSLNKLAELIEDLKNNRIDAVLMETTSALEFKAQNKGLKINTLMDVDVSFSVAVQKESEIKAEIDEALDHLRASGALLKLRQKWFKGL